MTIEDFHFLGKIYSQVFFPSFCGYCEHFFVILFPISIQDGNWFLWANFISRCYDTAGIKASNSLVLPGGLQKQLSCLWAFLGACSLACSLCSLPLLSLLKLLFFFSHSLSSRSATVTHHSVLTGFVSVLTRSVFGCWGDPSVSHLRHSH